MSKTIDSLVQASLDSKDFAGAILTRLELDGTTYRFCNAYQSVFWDEGAGEQEYLGLGNFASVSVLAETTELSAQTVQLTLSGVPNYLITDIFSTDYIGRPAYIWFATIDTDTHAVEGGADGPVLIFAGRMDYGGVEFGEKANLTVNVTSRLADWERPRGGRFNHVYQQRHVDSNDLGFKYVQSLQDKAISWGAISISDPGNGGGDHGTGCFIANTMITLQDGSKKFIKDTSVGDILFKDQEVLSNIEYLYMGYLYSINGGDFFVTDSHPFKTPQGWGAFDVKNAKKLNPDLNIVELKVGSELYKQDGSLERILSINTEEFNGAVFNLEVDGDNDYFANEYWVHNKEDIDVWD